MRDAAADRVLTGEDEDTEKRSGSVSETLSEAVVGTTYGRVRGRTANGVTAFKGIPYAAPPIGPRRLAAPPPPKAWDGVRDALEYGPTAPKGQYLTPFDQLLPEPSIPGDDCLNLNVWT